MACRIAKGVSRESFWMDQVLQSSDSLASKNVVNPWLGIYGGLGTL